MYVSLFLLALALGSLRLCEGEKVIIVADPGVDDSASILAALSHSHHDMEVIGLVAQFGVCSRECTLKNALELMHRVGPTKAVPVFAGAPHPLGEVPPLGVRPNSTALLYHGPQGLGSFQSYESPVGLQPRADMTGNPNPNPNPNF